MHSIEQQSPVWQPDTVQAYSPRVYGFILDECVRRITGADSLGQYFHESVAKPLGLDFYIGLPQSEHERVATLFPGKYQGGTSLFEQAFTTPGSITQRAFRSPAGLNTVQDLNLPETWAAGYVAMGGVGSARGLAQFYSAVLSRRDVIPSSPISGCSQPLSSAAEDQVLHVPMAFSTGMMQDRVLPDSMQKETQLFGPNASAFGHAGAGGSLAFADPATGISFAYVMNQMELGVLPGRKALGLVQALYSPQKGIPCS
jgi:CubicO group peptidase (beta-lactamase class C family)